MTKWLKMTQMTLKMIEKDMNEWNWLKTSEKKWKGLEIIKNDQKWQIVITGEKWQKWPKMTIKGSKICSKLIWYFNINCSIFKMLKNEETWLWVILRKNDKMTENDTKWLKKWLKRTWMSETDYKHQKEVKRTRNNQKWPKMTKCHHGKKWQKMTENDAERMINMF